MPPDLSGGMIAGKLGEMRPVAATLQQDTTPCVLIYPLRWKAASETKDSLTPAQKLGI
jgi:hypothetical protein